MTFMSFPVVAVVSSVRAAGDSVKAFAKSVLPDM